MNRPGFTNGFVHLFSLAAFTLCALFSGPLGARTPDDPSPGLYLQVDQQRAPLPLLNTRVTGKVAGFVANVSVTQSFVNPYNDFIEAIYLFPLPHKAAVTSMVMSFRDRTVKAEIKEREAAQKIYDDAKASGHTAALLNQERPNIFSQKAANIPPGEKVEVTITYVALLPFEKGVATFVFPEVVGPRYIPGTPTGGLSKEASGRIGDTTRVPDASRFTPPSFTEGEQGAHRIDLSLELSPGRPIRRITSVTHKIVTQKLGKNRRRITLDKTSRIPDRDFILNIDLRGEAPEAAVLAHRVPEQPGYFTLAIEPPALPKPDEVAARDLFFVVDNSGSMSGAPLNAAKRLVKEALVRLNPRDRFTIMRFSDTVSALSPTPLENTKENVAKGVSFINAMSGMGGTEMLSGIARALAGTPQKGRIRIVFFLTDGFIGNDDEIIGYVKQRNDAHARLFSMGVGSSVNRYLLDAMARAGRGEMQVITEDEDPKPFVDQFLARIQNPVLTDISLSWQGVQISDQVPMIVPDLFDGQPLLIHGRYTTGGAGTLTIRGKVGRRPFKQTIAVTLPDEHHRPEIAHLYARAKIEQWNNEETTRPGTRKEEITRMSLQHHLLSRYTAFVAVDKKVSRPKSAPLIPVAQRLPLPKGVSQNALSDLSRREIPPGDPFIQVAAPKDAKTVMAIFPFGLVKQLRYDEGRNLWRGRFLVPAGIPDGYYTVTIAIEDAKGRISYRQEGYHLDSQAEEFICNFKTIRVKAGRGFTIDVDTIEPAAEVYVHNLELGVKRALLSPKDDAAPTDWSLFVPITLDVTPGTYPLLVVVRDKAGNRLTKTVHITVTD